MKKLISIALCLCMIFAVACMTAGCGNDELLKRMDDLQATLQTQSGKIDELQNQNTNLTEKLDEMQTIIDGQTEVIEELKYKTTLGKFYTVSEAYENGFITLEDVKSMAYYHNGGREYNEEIMPENYSPIPKTPESLSREIQLQIKRDYITKYLIEVERPAVDNVKIDNYYGVYNGFAAVIISDNYHCMPGIEAGNTIDNVFIYYPVYNFIQLWRIDI